MAQVGRAMVLALMLTAKVSPVEMQRTSAVPFAVSPAVVPVYFTHKKAERGVS